MTDTEFDELLRKVMLQAAIEDCLELYAETEETEHQPSRRYQRETKRMLKNPKKWVRKREQWNRMEKNPRILQDAVGRRWRSK